MKIQRVGFIGLGTMGLPIARNLIKAGYSLFVGYHIRRDSAKEMEDLGAKVCTTFREVAENSDVIFTVLPNANEVEETLFSKNGLAEGLKEGSIVIDMSTIDLFLSRGFAERLQKQKVTFVDAPISGGPQGAQAGTLAIMVGAEPEIFERIESLLQAIGKKIICCGQSGLGLAAKLANNLIVGATIASVSESAALAVKAGVDPQKLFAILQGATANSAILQSKMPFWLSGEYPPAFKLELMAKDLRIATEVGRKLGTPLLVGNLVEQLFAMNNEGERSKEDCSALAKFYEEYAGVSLAASTQNDEAKEKGRK